MRLEFRFHSFRNYGYKRRGEPARQYKVTIVDILTDKECGSFFAFTKKDAFKLATKAVRKFL